ncbi:DUF4276 family protein [Flavobacterium sp. N3904]|uniref:DUF4276 family protein n=1 Tax=Flavobacterium sp. N3904 TaxID=2986835 RepID=UPI002224B847|nr:DUF4276 family protein [Flavobacterium sp. N3904]
MILNVLVEGQTEETFVKEVLNPYIDKYGIYAIPIIVSTKVVADGKNYKGGLSNFNWKYFNGDLQKLIYSTPHGLVTTFIDYYALPSKFPGYENRGNYATPRQRVAYLESELFLLYGSPKNFLPYIQLHEFEAMLFSDKCGFVNCVDERNANLEELCSIIENNKFPEDINDGPTTAPSKRILANYVEYDKVLEGNFILLEIGLETVLEKCPKLNEWIEKIIEFKNVNYPDKN